MDNALTSKIKDYLAQTESERSTVEGATLLLQLNRNKYFFNNAIRNPKRETVRAKIFRELNKWLNIRLDGLTAEQVAAMMPKVEMIGAELEALEPKTTTAEEGETSEATDDETPAMKAIAIASGRRADHDQLPAEIQARYVENLALLQKERSLHEKLKLMCDELPCDRYETAKLLIELDQQRIENWAAYDGYVLPTAEEGEPTTSETPEVTEPEPAATTAEEDAAAETAKKIQAARTYISRNVAKLRELRDDETKLVDYTTLKAKVQERYETLKELGAEISDETLTTLSDLGVRL
jgi:hypothetical protein